jgi:hypothetical protein
MTAQASCTVPRKFSGCHAQRRLQLLNTCWGCQTHDQSLFLRRFLRLLSTEAPSLHQHYLVSSVSTAVDQCLIPTHETVSTEAEGRKVSARAQA